MRSSRPIPALAALMALLAVAACGGSGGSDTGTQGASTGDPALDKLVTAARAEGQLTFYSVPAENEAQRVADAFAKKYGVHATFQRLVSSQLEQRYSAEAQSGAPAADVVLVSRSPFVVDAERKGWLIGPGKAHIPGYPDPTLPKRFRIGDIDSAIVQMVPSAIGFNTDEVSEDQAPKDWPDLLDPKYKGKILMPDPTSSPAYLDFWYSVERRYGVGYLRRLRAQVSRLFAGTVPMTEALAAGEGSVGVPAVGAVLAQLHAKGAPLGFAIPPVTAGPEIVVGISAKAKHPDAARLFARFLTSPEGTRLLDDDPGVISPYGGAKLPAGYTSVDHAEAMKHQSEIYGAFGVK